MNYKVSVLIPAYNAEQYIERCIDSIPNREDIQTIVVNDGSIDNTESIIKNKYLNKVEYYKNNRNLGIGLTRNILLDRAKGEYIFFLDSDDYIYSDNFNLIINDYLKDQIVLMPHHMRNDGKIFYPGVHRGDFIKRSFIKNLRHKDMRCQEDTQFKKDLKSLPGYKLEKIPILLYHYNEPRVGSLTWEDRKKKGVVGYQKGIKEWEETYSSFL